MKKTLLATALSLLTGFSLFVDASSQSNRDIEILREEIHRQKLILAALKEELAKLEEKEVDRIKIEIDTDGFRFRGDRVSGDELNEKISTTPADAPIIVMAERRTPYKKVVFVFDLLRDHGSSDVVLAAMDSEADEKDLSE